MGISKIPNTPVIIQTILPSSFISKDHEIQRQIGMPTPLYLASKERDSKGHFTIC